MQHKQLSDNKFILRFDTGDRFAGLFMQFLEDERIASGFVTGLGSFTEATIGFYDTEADHYNWHTLSGLHEVLSLTGNIAQYDGQRVFHIHLVAAGHDYNAVGGHLKDMTIGATCEVMVVTTETELKRKDSNYHELKTLDI